MGLNPAHLGIQTQIPWKTWLHPLEITAPTVIRCVDVLLCPMFMAVVLPVHQPPAILVRRRVDHVFQAKVV